MQNIENVTLQGCGAGQRGHGEPTWLPLGCIGKPSWLDTEAAWVDAKGWAMGWREGPGELGSPLPPRSQRPLGSSGPKEAAPGCSCFRLLGPCSRVQGRWESIPQPCPSRPWAPVPGTPPGLPVPPDAACPPLHGLSHLPCLTPPRASAPGTLHWPWPGRDALSLPCSSVPRLSVSPAPDTAAVLVSGAALATLPLLGVCVCLSVVSLSRRAAVSFTARSHNSQPAGPGR